MLTLSNSAYVKLAAACYLPALQGAAAPHRPTPCSCASPVSLPPLRVWSAQCLTRANMTHQHAAQVVHEALDKPRNIQYKGDTDLVTDTDKAAEAACLKEVQAALLGSRYSRRGGRRVRQHVVRLPLVHRSP